MGPLLDSLLAGAPIAVVPVLMIPLRWPATRAGLAGLAVALVVAVTAYGYGAGAPEGVGMAGAIGGALAEALATALSVLWIVLPALCIYRLQMVTGAVHTLRRTIDGVSPDPRLVGLLVAWFFSLFLEGAAGFGTPVALTAPFLLSMGYPPVEALSLALVGHAVGVTFGAVGAPVVPLLEATGLPPLVLSRRIGLLNATLGWVMAAMVTALVARAVRRTPALRRRVGGGAPTVWAILAAASFFAPYYAVAHWVGPELPSMLGGLVGGVLFVLAVRHRAEPGAAGDGERADDGEPRGSLGRAIAPYALLVALVAITRLVPAVRAPLQGTTWRWEMVGGFGAAFQPLYHPGTMLLISYVLGAFLVGAYQEILGDLHNLFGDTNAAHVNLTEEGDVVIESFIKGDTVTDVLDYVGFRRAELIERLQAAVERAVQQGKLDNTAAGRCLKFYEEALNGYTYLEKEEM